MRRIGLLIAPLRICHRQISGRQRRSPGLRTCPSSVPGLRAEGGMHHAAQSQTCGARLRRRVRLLLWSTPAWAPFHIVGDRAGLLRHARTAPTRSTSCCARWQPGQVFVDGQRLPTQNADGSSAGELRHLRPQSRQRRAPASPILIGTARRPGCCSASRLDQVVGGHLVFAGRPRLLRQLRRRRSTASPTAATPATTATSASRPCSPQLGMALVAHDASPRTTPTDFALGAPAPQNNAGQSGTLGTCGGVPPSRRRPTVRRRRPSRRRRSCVGDCDGSHHGHGRRAHHRASTSCSATRR